MKTSGVIWEIYMPNGPRVWRTEQTLWRQCSYGKRGERRGLNSIWSDFACFMETRLFKTT